jgi:signal transduction histidine kinase
LKGKPSKSKVVGEDANVLSTNLLKLIVDTSDVPAFAVEPSTRILYQNRSASDIFGIKDTFPRKKLSDHIPDDSVDTINRAFSGMAETGRLSEEHVVGIKVTGMKHKLMIVRLFMKESETTVPKEVFLMIFRMGPSRPLDPHGMKMASIGEFAAGIAHELNTPLANISLIAENLMEEIKDDRIKGELEKILTQVDFSARIVREILAFSRKDNPTFELVDLNAVIKDSLETMKFERTYKIELRLENELKPVKADPFQLQEVVMNLLQNAKEAMEDGGEIVVFSRNTNGWVEIEVQDNGGGIPKDIMDQIFQPFFTTKSHGQGVGLGLAICMRIVANHKGELTARNKPRKGAVFKLRLPKVQ